MRKGGEHYNYIAKDEKFPLIKDYVDKNEIEEAYKVANERGNQMARELTLYLLNEHLGVFREDPLEYLEYVPENYLYEAVDEDLCVYVHDGIKKIKDWAFAFCKIKKLIISNKVEYIGDGALSLNSGEIEYQGKKGDFIAKFMGKTKCFERTNRPQTISCTDGDLVINK